MEHIVLLMIQGFEIEKGCQFANIKSIEKCLIIFKKLASLLSVRACHFEAGFGIGEWLRNGKFIMFSHKTQKLLSFIQLEVEVVSSYEVHNQSGTKKFVHFFCCTFGISSDRIVLALNFALYLEPQGFMNLTYFIVCHFCSSMILIVLANITTYTACEQV